MNPSPEFPTANGRVRVAPLAEVREMDAWQQGLRNHTKDHRYYEIVADTLGFDCRAFVLEDSSGRVLATQPFFFVEQDLVVTAPAWIQAPVGFVRRAFPSFLRLKMLMLGCAAGEGSLVRTEGPAALVEALRATVLKAARAFGAKLVVWKDFPSGERTALKSLRSGPAGTRYVQIASMPATRMNFDFATFDEYLERRLSRVTRKSVRRKYKVLADAPPITMTVTNTLGEEMDEALALYEQVFARSSLQFERLNREFLRQLSARLPERVRYFLWRQEGRLVAFSLCLVHDGAIYDEYLGLDYRIALDLHLYFVTFRDVLTWALSQGLKSYCSTPLSYDPKFHLGFDLAPLDLYFALPWPWMNVLAQPFMRYMSPTRAEPVLASFANASEMEPAM
ncbi:GNAT family N-acetyltransferase [Chthoniobacter flavus]|nr:GNAT family N-acetyltransferase [Chthoniobacter flavus]